MQPPDASWGTIINDGQGLLYTRPWVAIAPGLAIVATVLCLNVLGDGVRDALDPARRGSGVEDALGDRASSSAGLVATLFVMFAISVLVFLIFFATPGVDPAARIAGRNADPETLKQVRHDFGLDRPLPVQYAIMMKKLFWSRDLTSFVNRGAKVIPQIADAAPVTFSLVIGAAIIWVVVAIAMGLTAAVMRGTFVDPLIMILGLIGISMPVFWLGEVVNLVTQSRLHEELFFWLPPLGYTPVHEHPTGWFLRLIFPWLTLSVAYIGSTAGCCDRA